jgi:hypothetical protein
MRRGAITAALAACGLLVAALGSCGKDPAASPPAAASPLPTLAAAAELWAGRADALLRRGWITRLEFRQRLFGRVQSLRSFAQEAGSAADGAAGPRDRLVERGRELVDHSASFDDALALLEQVAGTLDQLTGYERAIELQMAPLESRGEAPYRIRVTDYGKQVALGFTHLDLALAGTVEKAKDAKLHQNIATRALSDALATATKLHEDLKKTGALAKAAIDRQRRLKDVISWAGAIAAKDGAKVPPEAAKALEEARKTSEEIGPETDRVLESLRGAQPDAAAKAEELAARVDAPIERVTRAFLPIGREAGVPDPK